MKLASLLRRIACGLSCSGLLLGCPGSKRGMGVRTPASHRRW